MVVAVTVAMCGVGGGGGSGGGEGGGLNVPGVGDGQNWPSVRKGSDVVGSHSVDLATLDNDESAE